MDKNEVFNRISKKLEDHGKRATELVRFVNEQLKDVEPDYSNDKECLRLYNGDRAVLSFTDEYVSILFKPEDSHRMTIREMFTSSKSRYVYTYSSISVTDAESMWIDANRDVNANTVNVLAEYILSDERLYKAIEDEAKYIAEKYAVNSAYSDEAKSMFGI